MKDKSNFIRVIQFLSVILLYYLAGEKSMFLYVITLSLYNIYLSCFSHVTLKDMLNKINSNYGKFKLLKNISIVTLSVCMIFVIISILLSDTINIFLNIKNTFLPYLLMSISVITEPLIKILMEYLESYNKLKLSKILFNGFYVFEVFFFLLIAILSMLVCKVPTYISIALIYLSKILSFILIGVVTLFVLNKLNINFDTKDDDKSLNYKKITKEILTNNSHKSVILLVKNSYYYMSIIILYMILSTRYSYNINEVENIITFIYLYCLSIINLIINMIISLVGDNRKKKGIIGDIITSFNFMTIISIFLAITSPLICKIIFNDSSNSMYLMMMGFLSIFVVLFNITFNNINNKKIIYTSLIFGVIVKLILVVPLINAFYRMGYNLVYGDIISTIISMSISVIINYIYIKGKNKKEKVLDRVLSVLYDSILLCIVLVILQFILPIKTNSYIWSIILLGIYLFISIMFFRIKKKRG